MRGGCDIHGEDLTCPEGKKKEKKKRTRRRAGRRERERRKEVGKS